ncbi:DEAD/DEAH box helicase [Yinghuangia seranimata]|uniref:DEAD/DEAH box helicase n=1 Tax=Yinghuangia seranimata TaxID=408067 RepID=UPI00248B5521|nr:DEAD/DEAH box helicase family protein [Yinghuangia seranimata]MDI2127166.1 DEAD/DEAH box helicase family protein [Yinghuangia seranimata]
MEEGPEGQLAVSGQFGSWPAIRAGNSTGDQLTALIPTVRTGTGQVTWLGDKALLSPNTVLDSFVDGIGFRPHTDEHSLRRPQIGALHSVLGYWSSGIPDPGVVVMPTGTGKTETMLALLVASRPAKLLVLVPSSALRDQIARKFETLGVLQKFEIVTPDVLRPCVGRLEHGFKDVASAAAFGAACNVVVATPHALHACDPLARDVLLESFSHLIVDEAHHAPAASWTSVIEGFTGRSVLLFTATPFREDGRALPGRTIFRFPLREAQRDGYFTTIDYRAVLNLESTDAILTQLAVERLRRDLADGYDHILMARAKSIARAEEIVELYRREAPDLGPAVLHERLPARRRKQALASLDDRSCRIVVCVDMLGEGFDLPALKIAALHDVKKSLSPMIQFIGRFTRSTGDSKIGTASVFVGRDPSVALAPLRDLLREDADWNLILHDVTERASSAVEAIGEFEASFVGGPPEVSVAVLEPKMSAIAHRAPTREWDPDRALSVYGADRVLGANIATNASSSVAWFVLEHRDGVSWGAAHALEETTYELVIMYFNRSQRVLFVHGSHNSSHFAELAQAVLGAESQRIEGPTALRVLARLDRLIPTNIGLLDARSHFNRFSMHVGSDVNEALNTADKQGKSQTHIATSGYDEGEKVTISAAVSGRFWSMRTAPNLKSWTDWCDAQGAKLLDDSISLDDILEGFVIPQDLTERPPYVLLALEWPWELFLGTGSSRSISYAGSAYPVADVDLAVDDFSSTGPFLFSLVTPAWRLRYRGDFTAAGLAYSPVGDDAEVVTTRQRTPLADWFSRHKPSLFLEGDRMITAQSRLHAPRYDQLPYDRALLRVLTWAGVDLQKESQGPERRADSIQAFMSAYLQTAQEFNVLLDDDRAGEAADLVGIKLHNGELSVTLVHCKYSSDPKPGARLADLYELTGQAIRGAKWRQGGFDALLHHLDRRARDYKSRTGKSPYEVGDIEELYRIRQLAPQLKPRFHTVLAQPGLSAQACTAEHLRVLAGAQSYLHTVTRGSFTVYCSA